MADEQTTTSQLRVVKMASDTTLRNRGRAGLLSSSPLWRPPLRTAMQAAGSLGDDEAGDDEAPHPL
eukprot:11162794-Lingulodinium_polyedra.AAC.1